jgi:hypothetical protein
MRKGGKTKLATRRDVLKSGAVIAAGATMMPLAQDGALAQGAADLAQVQKQRRILLKGGIVLSGDSGVGDFAPGDVLIENGKIRVSESFGLSAICFISFVRVRS